MIPVPVAESADVALNDGSTVALRPASPADVPALRAFYAGLTVETLYFRFFRVTKVSAKRSTTKRPMLDRRGYNPPNRMLIHELTTAQCREVLARTSLGRLACARDDQPYIVPVFFSFDVDDNCLYSFSTVGQKVEWMRANPKVCVEVEEIADQFHWTTVLITGRYDEIRTAKEESIARERAQELLQRRPQWWLPAAANLATSEERDQPVFYRIVIDKLSGRRAARPA